MRLLMAAIGADAVEALLDAYIAQAPPMLFPSDEALAFKRFFESRGRAAPGLIETLRFEAAVIEAIVDERTVRVAITGDDGAPRLWEVGAAPRPYVREIAATAPRPS